MSESQPTPIETAVAQPDQPVKPTPLTEFLLRTTPAFELRTHEGCATPAFFDEADRNSGSEVNQALDSAVVLDLGWLARIAVTGEDRARWLAGMTTNAVQTLAEGGGNYNFVLNAQGRIQGDLYAFREHDRFILETTKAQIQRLLSHLDHFIIMDDVEIRSLTDLTALGIAGPASEEVLWKLGFDATQVNLPGQREWLWNGIAVTVVRAYSIQIPRFELWFAPEHVATIWTRLLENGCHPAGNDAAQILRVAEGIPTYGVDILEKHLAQETSQTRALNFSKGCYLGQEIVERIRSRANIHRTLKQFELKGSLPAPGTDLSSDGKTVGQLTSVTTLNRNGEPRIFAIGTIRTEVLSSNAPIEYEGGSAIPLQTPPEGLSVRPAAGADVSNGSNESGIKNGQE